MKLVRDMSDPPITIEVFGNAKPAGSKKAMPVGGRNPTGRWTVVDDNRQAGPWKIQVAQEAGLQYRGPLLTGPLSVEMVFFQIRPKGHSGTGRNAGLIKDSAPSYPCARPDVLKLARAIEDALTGVVYRDDSLIVDERIAKRYGDRAGVKIRIWPVAERTVQDLVAAGKVEPEQPTEKWKQLAIEIAA